MLYRLTISFVAKGLTVLSFGRSSCRSYCKIVICVCCVLCSLPQRLVDHLLSSVSLRGIPSDHPPPLISLFAGLGFLEGQLFSSSSANFGSVMLLDVAEDDKLVGGTKLSFAVRKMEQRKGRSNKTR